MENLKDRMYNFEVTPPASVWDSITKNLDSGVGSLPIKQKKTNKKLYFILAAAACVMALVFIGTRFMLPANNEAKEYTIVTPINTNENSTSIEKKDSTEKITAPKKIEKTIVDRNKHNEALVKNITPKKQSSDSSTDPLPDSNDEASAEPANSYITISGPEGQPVNVSSKVASLIESSDNSYPPKPVWNKRINKWKDIMKANTFTPTTGNFLDIVDLTNSLKEK